MRRLTRHLTYANVMVTLLAFVVLGGGTALAAFIVNSNSDVGPDTISGHNPPPGASPNLIAGSVDQTDLAPDAQMCRTDGTLHLTTAAGNNDGLICAAGALRVRARCQFFQRETVATVYIRSALDHAWFSAHPSGSHSSLDDPDVGPSDGFQPVFSRSALVTGAAVADHASFAAGAPDGSQLIGGIGVRVQQPSAGPSGTCDFVLGAFE